MTANPEHKRPWDRLEYQQIVAASYQNGELTVRFADGTEARLSPQCLIPAGAPEPDWSTVRAEEFHLVMSSPQGEIEIPWDVIRVRTDPAYDEHWAQLAAVRV